MQINVKNQIEIDIMREAGRRLFFVMQELEKVAGVGVTTAELNQLAEELIRKQGAEPAFLGYGEKKNPFPATICASLNQQVVHGTPSAEVVLQSGDLLKIDIGLKYEGFFVDMARTLLIGEVSREGCQLAEVAEQAFWQGLKKIKAGVDLREYGREVQKYVEGQGFTVVRDLVGHGIGRELHEAPQIPNYFDRRFPKIKLQAGMTLALEPMINVGKPGTTLDSDGWAFLTVDGKLSAHYENTVLVTENGVEVLTSC